MKLYTIKDYKKKIKKEFKNSGNIDGFILGYHLIALGNNKTSKKMNLFW